MIEFKGALSKETEKFVLREHKKVDWFVWTIAGLLFGTFVTIFSITVKLIFALFLIPILVLFVCLALPYAKYERKAMEILGEWQ